MKQTKYYTFVAEKEVAEGVDGVGYLDEYCAFDALRIAVPIAFDCQFFEIPVGAWDQCSLRANDLLGDRRVGFVEAVKSGGW